MRELVAFDLDDTLVPETLFLRSGIFHIADWLAVRFPEISPRRVVDVMLAAVASRRNHYSALETLLADIGMSGAVDMKSVVMEFRNHVPDPDIYHLSPSSHSALSNLKAMGIAMALITDGRSATQRNKIRAAALEEFFSPDDILISGETGHDKNDPDNFLFLMRKYAGISKFHYVGDNPAKDFRHPRVLGWETHLVTPFPLAIHTGGGVVRVFPDSGGSAGSVSIADLPSLFSRCGGCSTPGVWRP